MTSSNWRRPSSGTHLPSETSVSSLRLRPDLRRRSAGRDAYPDLLTKAGALLQSIVNNHALVDGNKRLGWVATAVFLEINEVTTTHVSNDAIYELVMTVAATRPDLDSIVAALVRLLGSETRGGPNLR